MPRRKKVEKPNFPETKFLESDEVTATLYPDGSLEIEGEDDAWISWADFMKEEHQAEPDHSDPITQLSTVLGEAVPTDPAAVQTKSEQKEEEPEPEPKPKPKRARKKASKKTAKPRAPEDEPEEKGRTLTASEERTETLRAQLLERHSAELERAQIALEESVSADGLDHPLAGVYAHAKAVGATPQVVMFGRVAETYTRLIAAHGNAPTEVVRSLRRKLASELFLVNVCEDMEEVPF